MIGVGGGGLKAWADFDEPLSEATLSLYLRKLVQAEIDRSFKLGLSGTGAKPANQHAAASAPQAGGETTLPPCRRS